MTEIDKKTLKDWRITLGIATAKELAEIAECSPSIVSNIERGETSPSSPTAIRIANILGLKPDQVLPGSHAAEDIDLSPILQEGYPDQPRNTLKWWRERRTLGVRELSRLSGVSIAVIAHIENGKGKGHYPQGVRKITRRKLAKALAVAPDHLIFPGDSDKPSEEQALERQLSADLRGARSALKKACDILIEDPNLSFKGQDKRDAVWADLIRELRGT
jgi:transcriptional regulator with XRE-family HTH domain